MPLITSLHRLTVPLFVILLYSLQFLSLVALYEHNNASLPRTLSMNAFIGESPVATINSSTTVSPFNYSNHKFCLIHIGKAAGSKVSCELGYTYAPECRKRHAASNFTTSFLQDHRGGVRHMGMAVDCTSQTRDDQVFLLTLRHPVYRLVSWYKYEHLRNRRIQMNPKVKRGISCLNHFHNFQNNSGCFASLEEFALNTVSPQNTSNATDCQRLAWNVASATTPCMWHNSMGYQYYQEIIDEVVAVSNTTTKPHVLVMRSEHLQQDWNSLERLFRGERTDETINTTTTNINIESTLNNSQQKKKDTLSKEGTRNLCRAQCREIQVYKDLLYRAENLNATQREESIVELMKLCPEETAEIQVCDNKHNEQLSVAQS